MVPGALTLCFASFVCVLVCVLALSCAGIIDMSTLRLSSQLHDAHETGINRVCFYDENMLVSGDDDGFVHVWDLRAHNMAANAAAATVSTARAAAAAPSKAHGSTLYPLLRYQDAGDYISDILPVPSKNRMVITSGDGHLYVYDMRAGHIHEKVAIAHGRKAQPKPKALGKSKAAQSKKLTPSGHMAPGGQATDTWFAMSDDVEDELSGAVLLKRGRKLVCAGREEGVLNVFKWDYFGVAEDHFNLGAAGNESEGSGASVDSIIKVDEDTVLTGSTDGLIRLVQLHPNKLLSILGTHDDFPIECMRMSPDVRGYFAGANVPDTPAAAAVPAADDSDDDEDDSEGDDGPSSAYVAGQKDADTDAAFEAAMASLAPGYSGLVPRFLASSSHDNQVKFWNCSELYEVDPDEVREDDDSDSSDSDNDDDDDGGAKGKGKSKAKGDHSAKDKSKSNKEEEEDEEDSDDDGDEKAAEAEAEASMAQKHKSAVSAKRKQRASPDSDEDADEDGEDEEDEEDEDGGEDADSDSGEGEKSPSASEASGDEGKSGEDEDDEDEAALAKPASLSLFARLAPAAASSATAAAAAKPAAAAPAPAAAAGTPNMWMLVAPTTSAAAKGKADGSGSDGSGSDSDSEPSAKRRRKDGLDLNAGTGFFANLPASHPMHPSQQHKRAAKAPLKLEVDNIAHRPAKKRAALQEKLRLRAEKKARLAERKAAAVANGEDPDLLELSSDEEQGGGGGGKKRKLNAGGARRSAPGDSDDSDDSDADSDDSDAKPKKEPKERKMTAKEKKAAKKLERKKNPFFSGL